MEPGLEAQAFFDPANFVYPFGTHVAIVEIHGPDAPGGGLVALRLSMVTELPQCIGKTWKDPQSAPWPCYQKPDSARPGGKPPA